MDKLYYDKHQSNRDHLRNIKNQLEKSYDVGAPQPEPLSSKERFLIDDNKYCLRRLKFLRKSISTKVNKLIRSGVIEESPELYDLPDLLEYSINYLDCYLKCDPYFIYSWDQYAHALERMLEIIRIINTDLNTHRVHSVCLTVYTLLINWIGSIHITEDYTLDLSDLSNTDRDTYHYNLGNGFLISPDSIDINYEASRIKVSRLELENKQIMNISYQDQLFLEEDCNNLGLDLSTRLLIDCPVTLDNILLTQRVDRIAVSGLDLDSYRNPFFSDKFMNFTNFTYAFGEEPCMPPGYEMVDGRIIYDSDSELQF